jgi:hypothetical protein
MTAETEIRRLAMSEITPDQHNFPIIVFRRDGGAMLPDLLLHKGVVSVLPGSDNIIFPSAPDVFWYTMTEDSLEAQYKYRPVVVVWMKKGVVVRTMAL